MSYRIEHDEPVVDAIRRIAGEQLGGALDDLEPDRLERDVEAAVHDVRKRCKKLRGLVRAVRPALGSSTYERANRTARDAARELSAARDATSRHETLGRLGRGTGVECRRVLARLADAAATRRRAVVDRLGPDDPRVERARDLLVATRAQIGDWELDAEGWEAIGPGVAKTYGRACRGVERSESAPTTHHFHEWRKRVKYSWYHTRLVAHTAPSPLRRRARRLHALSDTLGDAHDLALLARWARGDDPAVASIGDRTPALVLIEGVRSELRTRALGAGRRLFAETADAHADRLGAYWRAWEGDPSPPPLAEMTDLV